MNVRQVLLLVTAVCVLGNNGLPQAKRRSAQRVPMDLVQFFARDPDVKGCLDSEYGGDIVRFANDLEALGTDPKEPPFVALIDLNNDGRPEFLINAPVRCGFCGSGGCASYVYQKWSNPDGYRLLLEIDVGWVNTKGTMTDGYRDLVVTSKTGTSDVKYATYKFSGNRYKLTECHTVLKVGRRTKIGKCD